MRHWLLITAVITTSAVVLSSCGGDDQLGAFTPEHPPVPEAVVNETTDLAFDFEAAPVAIEVMPIVAGDSESGAIADPAPTTTASVQIPDGAIDLTGQADITIDVKDNAFAQRVIVVTEGTAVTWANGGLAPHNVIPSMDDAFKPILTGELDAGQTATLTFTTAGAIPYYCSLHGTPRHGMNGLIVVVPAA